MWIQIPMENPKKQAYSYREDINVDEMEIESTWQWWNQFRTICDFDRKLIVALIISNDLPDEEEVRHYIHLKLLKEDKAFDFLNDSVRNDCWVYKLCSFYNWS